MKNRLILVAICHLLFAVCLSSVAQGTSFTYQGRLNDGANPANGSYDLRFAIYDALTVGTQQGGLLTNSVTAVSNGLFTVTLDFGNQFPGANRWLEIAVRTNGASSFFTLSPRQPLTPSPYAITAESVISGGLASGTYSNAVNFKNAADQFTGSFTGNGLNISNVNASTLNGFGPQSFWQLGGNTNTSPGANFIGTADNQPLQLHVNGQRAFRLEPGINTNGAPNVIGGASLNFVLPGVVGAVIGGGGATNYNPFSVGGPIPGSNSVTADFGTIAGGFQNSAKGVLSSIAGGIANTIQVSNYAAVIGGGYANTIFTNSPGSTIAGGWVNSISAGSAQAVIGGRDGNFILQGANYSTIGGGYFNRINVLDVNATIGGGMGNAIKGSSATIAGGQNNFAFGLAATIGGGDGNAINAAAYTAISGGQSNYIAINSDYATIGGGLFNTNGSQYSTIGGGWFNQIPNNGFSYNTIGGGEFNISSGGDATVSGGDGNTASGLGSTVPGGFANTAAGYDSFAAGTGAVANHDSTFVWSDGIIAQNGSFISTAPNQFLIHAVGGVGIGLNNPSGALHVASSNSAPQFQITQQSSSDYTRLRMNVGSYQSWEMDVSPGSTPSLQFWNSTLRAYIDFNGNLFAASFNNTSDRNAKENFQSVNPGEILDKVAALPLSRWNYKEDKSSEHIGPMAQDFYAAFNVGPDDKHITTVDEGGVALAAIQGLNEKVEARGQKSEDRIQKLETENAELKRRLETLEEIIRNQKLK